VAVAQSVEFACGLRTTEFVCCLFVESGLTVLEAETGLSVSAVFLLAQNYHILWYAVAIFSGTMIQTGRLHVRVEAFTAVTMKNVVFWDVTPYGCCKNRCFGGTLRASVASYG
jgi:hypothetical protein